MPVLYPFSAVLGCDASAAPLDPMGLALILNAISPDIGGVLVRGEKGTAKSTTVRALAEVLPPVQVFAGDRFSVDPADPADATGASSPDGPFPDTEPTTRPVRLVELPVGAGEERVVGSLDLAAVLSEGTVAFEPGLLARAHRGVLYVDEVNLLGDHLVDLLLDAAATGRVSVERDAVSLTHAARFVLIGTMNPEEGELRPQLLDRFGLTVEVAAPRDPALRVEVVRRRLAFDADPAGFAARYTAAQQQVRERIVAARAAVPDVQVGDAALFKIAEVCAAFDVDGLRADIVTTRTATAHAAWRGSRFVTKADIRVAALLALPHRRRRTPFDAPGLDEDLLDAILGDDDLPDPDPGDDPDPSGGSRGPDQRPEGGNADGGEGTVPDPADSDDPARGQDPTSTGGPAEQSSDPADDGTDDRAQDRPDQSDEQPGERSGAAGGDQRVSAGAPFRPRVLTVAGTGPARPDASHSGKRSPALGSRGARIGSVPMGTRGAGLHLVDTVRAAAERRVLTPRPENGRLRFVPADLRASIRRGQEANLLVFCVDASGSMAARKRMGQVKAAILSLLTDAYRRRDKVALITFRGSGAEVVLPPTGSVEVAVARLDALSTGGRTPIAEGLVEAERLVNRERHRHGALRPLLIVVTDGRATAGPDPVTRSRTAAEAIARGGVRTVLLDSESGPLRLGLGLTLAAHLGAEHLPVEHLEVHHLTTTVKGRVA